MNETAMPRPLRTACAALCSHVLRCLGAGRRRSSRRPPYPGGARAAQPGLRAARRPARHRSTAAAPIRRAPSRSGATRRRPTASRPSSTGCPRRRGGWAARAAASSRCSAASRSNAARSTTRSSRCAANLDRVLADLQRLQGNSADREGQRRAILAALAQNDCGPQYRAYANRGARRLLREPVRRRHRSSRNSAPETMPPAATPSAPSACAPATATISRSRIRPRRASSPTTSRPASACARPRKSRSTATAIRARTCRRRCRSTAAPTRSCRTPSPTARRSIRPAAAAAPARPGPTRCKHLDDQTVERGDIVVTEERAQARCRSRRPTRRAGRSG